MQITDLDPDKHGAQVFDLRVRTFSTATGLAYDPDELYVPEGRRLVALDGDRVVGNLGIWEFGQNFGGGRVPMGGVGGVAVEATHRGSGVGSALVAAGIQRMRELGDAVSTLYPATVVPYRRWGWEIAGVRMRRTVPTRALRDLPSPTRPGTVREATPDDLPALVELHDRVTAAEAGGLAAGERWLRRNLTPDPDDGDVVHVVERDGYPVGFVHHERDSATDDHSSWLQVVHRLVGADHDAELALWRFLGGASSLAADTRFVSRPAEPLLWDLPEIDVHDAPFPQHWMTRMIDPVAAVAARGFPAGLDVTVPLEIVDDRVPEAGGQFVLEVTDGRGTLTAGGGGGRVRLDTRAFAALFTGFASARPLRHRGALGDAGDADVAALAAAFDGPTPFLRDYF